MKQKKLSLILALIVSSALILGAAYWWKKQQSAASDAKDGAEPAAEAVSALVKTQPIGQQAMESNLIAYGDVVSAKVNSLSFPQAGQLTLLSVLPGQQVHRGETLAILTSDPNAQTAYVQALTAANFARAELKREEELFALKLLTQTQLDTAKKQLQDAESVLASQKKLGGETEAAKLLAPVDGVVTALVAAQGDRLAAGATVVQVGETNTLRIALGIEPAQRRMLHAGMKVILSTVGDAGTTINAKINEVQNVVDPKTQLVSAIVLLPASAAPTLVAGMHVQATIHLGQQQAWLVPRQAVLSDEKGTFIFQVADGKAHRVEVAKVNESATHFGIDGEIDPKLPVVVLGNYELEDDMAVRESGK